MAHVEDTLTRFIITTTFGSYTDHGEQPATSLFDLVKHCNKQIVTN